MAEKLSFELASLFVDASLKGRKIAWHTDPLSMRLYRLYYSGWYRSVISFVALCHMALTFLEPPTTYRKYPAEPLGVIDTRGFEIVILACYAADIAVRIRFMGWRHFAGAWNIAELVATGAFALDVLVQLATNGSALQFSRFIRPIFLVSRRKHVRFIFTGIVRSLPGQAPAFALIVGCVLASALAAPLFFDKHISPFFHHLPDDRQPYPPHCSAFSEGACDAYFDSMDESFYNLFILMTRTNWPVVILPYYAISQWSGLFFVVFLLFTQFFMYRLLLAIAAADFADHSRELIAAQQRRSQAALRGAYALLLSSDATGAVLGVDLATFTELAARVRPWLHTQVVAIIFRAAGGGAQRLTSDAFVAAASLLEISAVKLRLEADSSSGLLSPARQFVARWLHDWRVRLISDAVVLSLSIAGLELSYDHTVHIPGGVTSLNTPARVLAFVTLVLLYVEAAIKLVAFGPARYWGVIRPTLNRIDTLALVIGTACIALDASGLEVVPGRIPTKAMLVVRAFRLAMSELEHVPAFVVVSTAIHRVLPLFWRKTVVIGITLYSLGVLGMEAIGGVLLKSGGVGNSAAVASSAYGQAGQWSLNMNTFSEALMACFAVLVNTQAPLLMEGAMAGLNSWGPAWYFLVVYLLLVCVVSNVCIALVMQAYAAIAANVRQRLAGRAELWQHLLAAAEADLHAADPGSFPLARSWSFQRSSAFSALNEALFGGSLALQFVEAPHEKQPKGSHSHGSRASATRRWWLVDALGTCLPPATLQWAFGGSWSSRLPASPVLAQGSLRVYTPAPRISGLVGVSAPNSEKIPGISTRLLTEFVVSTLVAEDDDWTAATPGTFRASGLSPCSGDAAATSAAALLAAEKSFHLERISLLQAALAHEQRDLRRLTAGGSRISGGTDSSRASFASLRVSRSPVFPRLSPARDRRESEAQPLLLAGEYPARGRSRSVDTPATAIEAVRQRLQLLGSGVRAEVPPPRHTELRTVRVAPLHPATSGLSSTPGIELHDIGAPRMHRDGSVDSFGLFQAAGVASSSPVALKGSLSRAASYDSIRQGAQGSEGSEEGGEAADGEASSRRVGGAFIRIDSSGLLCITDTPVSEV